jgi:phosphoribosyl 1,2-cyclic phosphodiesterase
MRVRFWGVRGSIPYATPESIRCGCNTPCVELEDEQSNRRLILDAGSGIVGAGADDRTDAHVLLTHYHWDHVQGLPFFGPLHRPGSSVTVWCPVLGRAAVNVESIFSPPFFPVACNRLPSRPTIQPIGRGTTTVNDFRVSTQLLHHPGGSFAYRIEGTAGALVYATDHEFGHAETDAAFAQFVAGAHALILDSHFSPEEQAEHRGWGHGDWRRAAEFAAACGIARLWLFHHKPGRSDADVGEFEAAARHLFPATTAAKEGDTFEV